MHSLAVASKLLPNNPVQAEQLVKSIAMAVILISKGDTSSYVTFLRSGAYPQNAIALPHMLQMEPSLFINCLLSGTTLQRDVMIRRQMFEYVAKQMFGAAVSIFPTYRRNETAWKDDFFFAMSAILSRGLSGPDMPLSMVPLLDLANHSDHYNAQHCFNQRSGCFELVSLKDINDNEEVSISYGEGRDSNSFMLLYGFLGNPMNPNNHLRLTIELSSTFMLKDSGEAATSKCIELAPKLNIKVYRRPKGLVGIQLSPSLSFLSKHNGLMDANHQSITESELNAAVCIALQHVASCVETTQSLHDQDHKYRMIKTEVQQSIYNGIQKMLCKEMLDGYNYVDERLEVRVDDFRDTENTALKFLLHVTTYDFNNASAVPFRTKGDVASKDITVLHPSYLRWRSECAAVTAQQLMGLLQFLSVLKQPEVS
jgi:hypothetical protein